MGNEFLSGVFLLFKVYFSFYVLARRFERFLSTKLIRLDCVSCCCSCWHVHCWAVCQGFDFYTKQFIFVVFRIVWPFVYEILNVCKIRKKKPSLMNEQSHGQMVVFQYSLEIKSDREVFNHENYFLTLEN